MKEENNKQLLKKTTDVKEVKDSLDQVSNIDMEIKRYIVIYIILL